MTSSEIFIVLAVFAVLASFLEACLAGIHYATLPFAWAFRRRNRRYLQSRKTPDAPTEAPNTLDPAAHAAVAPPATRSEALANAAVQPLDFAAVYRAEQAHLRHRDDPLMQAEAARSPEKMAAFKAMMVTDKTNADTAVLPECRCRHCIEAREGQWGLAQTFVVCPQCGNKRCPRADNHKFDCSGSNDLNQHPTIDGKPVEP